MSLGDNGATRFVPRVEGLEDRTVPDGNVQVMLFDGTLYVSGDDAGNQIQIAGNGNQSVVVRPLDAATTINGSHNEIQVKDITRDLFIRMHGGDDNLLVSSIRNNGTLNVDMGDGDDILGITDAGNRSATILATGAGDDIANLNGFVARRYLSLDTGAGDDQVIAQSIGAVNFGLTNLSGNDFFDNRGSTFARPAIVGFTNGIRPPKATPTAPDTPTTPTTPTTPDTPATPTTPTTPTAPTAPTISVIADQIITQNSATPALPFTVSSTNTAVANVIVTAASSNQTLVPNASVILVGSGANRTVMVTPAANQSGTAGITLTVNDGTLTATRTFNLTVNSMSLPSFTATNPPTVNFNAGAQTVTNFATFTPSLNGGTTPTYTVSSVSNPGLFSVLPAVAANGTLTYTPVTGGFGSSTFTVQVSDGTTNSAPQTFTIRVDPVKGVSPTTIPGTAISLSDPNWIAISTVVPASNSAGIPAGTVADGTRILDVVVGSGATVARGARVTVAYKGYLLNGMIFDQNMSAHFTASELNLIPGFAAGLIGMRVGGTRRIDISSYLAYGGGTNVGTPNSRLVFEVTVNSIP